MTRTFGYSRQILPEAKQVSGMIKLEIFNEFLKIKCESMKTRCDRHMGCSASCIAFRNPTGILRVDHKTRENLPTTPTLHSLLTGRGQQKPLLKSALTHFFCFQCKNRLQKESHQNL